MLNLEDRFVKISLLQLFATNMILMLWNLLLTCFIYFCCFDQVHFLYKGTLRVLLVLLHDFPKFLCDYHFTFCDVIPPSCIQMRNIILSAFPRSMRLPDPSTPNLKVSRLKSNLYISFLVKRNINLTWLCSLLCRLICFKK